MERILRPLGYREIFDETFELLKGHFPVLFGIAAVVSVPFSILFAYLNQHLLSQMDETAIPTMADVETVLLLFGLLTAVYTVTATIVGGGIYRAISQQYFGKRASIASALGYVLKRAIPFLITVLLPLCVALTAVLLLALAIAAPVGALVWVGTGIPEAGAVIGLLVALPVVGLGWFLVVLALVFLIPVFIVEDVRYLRALRRSLQLARGQMLRIFVVYLIAVLASMAVQLIVASPAGLLSLAFDSGAPVVLAVEGVLNGIGVALSMPIHIIPLILLYFDVRIRREGFDIELLAERLRAEPSPAPPAATPPVR